MKKHLALTAFLSFTVLSFSSMIVNAQDTVYYQSPRLRVASLKDCDYYSVKTTDSGSNHIQELRFRPDGSQQDEEHYYVLGNEKIKYGRWKSWYSNGKLSSVINYKDNRKEGLLETYWPDGQLKRQDTFANDSCIAGVCYNQAGKEIKHFDYQTAAHFPGGQDALYNFLAKKIYFPQTTLPVEGDEKVVLRFLVTEEGKVTNLTIMNNPEKNMAGQVLHAFKKMPKWAPATIDGEPVGQYITFPVSFIRN